MIKSVCILLLLFYSVTGAGQDLSSYEKHYFNPPALNLPYRLLKPLHLDPSKNYPLLIFLHGAREKGFDNEQQLITGAAYFLLDSIREHYPAYVIFPQCPLADSWAFFQRLPGASENDVNVEFPFLEKPTEASGVLLELVDSICRAEKIDISRIYIGGLSQGGMGVLDLIARYPEKFAAAFSICGAGKVSTCSRFAGKTALWLFHGSLDNVVPVSFSRNYYKKLQKLHADVRYSEYEEVYHNSWVNAFRDLV